ncbi:MAG: four helix bundle protein [Thermodesulfovibrionales bacterium]|nr:four helix bundle protein [Thermodesulfovibrionales bacterium]
MRNVDFGMQNTGSKDLKKRTKQFAIEIIKFVEKLPENRITNVLGRQLLKSGTSVGANYRAACRAKSKADFIAKMGIVEEEADESLYWLELLVDTAIVERDAVNSLMDEANEIVAITISSIRTVRGNKK